MRSAPALLVILLVIGPVVILPAPSFSAARAQDIHLPFALDDLRLSTVAWKFPLQEFVKDASIVCCRIEGKDLFVLDSTNTVHCVEVKRGVHRWVLELPGEPTFPAGVSGEYMGYVIKDRLVLLRRRNGSRILDKHLRILPSTPPAVNAQAAYVGVFIHKQVTSIEAASGITGWSYRFEDFVTVTPRLYGKDADLYLYVASTDGSVVCLDPRPALGIPPDKPVWSFRTRGRNTAELAFSDKHLFVASEDSAVYAFDRLTGAVDWKYYAGCALKKAPQVQGDRVFLDTGREFLCMDEAKGTVLWTLEKGDFLAAVVGKLAYVWTRDGTLALVDLAKGEVVKEMKPEGDCKVVPNMGSAMLVVVKGNDVYGVR